VTTQIQKKASQQEQEEMLASELQLIHLLKENADILQRHPELLAVLEVPHQSGAAESLIERQVGVLRQNLKATEKRLRDLMDIARDNERLAKSRQQIAVNLLGAHDLEDVISIVLDELKNELKADFARVRLFSDNTGLTEQHPGLFVSPRAPELSAFSTMLKHKNPVCGRCSEEQRDFLFGEEAEAVSSAAVIPLVAGADLGLLGLGGSDSERFQSTMGTEFLRQVGDLVSAALAVHLEK
jgi:uncharacterized protein YigA (DUF484 family)